MCSAEPLSPETLVAAVCQDYISDEINEVDIDIDFVLGACQNLLVVNQKLHECRFSHLSVQEYFEDHHWRYNEADALIAKACLKLLNSQTEKQLEEEIPSSQSIDSSSDPGHLRTSGDSNKGNHTSVINLLLKYAQTYWMVHVHRCDKQQEVDSQLTKFLKKFLGSMNESSIQYRIWHRSISMRDCYRRAELGFSSYSLEPSSSASLSICLFGIYRLLQDWWEIGFDNIHQKSSGGLSLLHLAAEGGNVLVVQALLERGLNVNTWSIVNGTPLCVAAGNRSLEMVKFILQNGADVNAKGGYYGTALQAASLVGRPEVVKMLLDHGANVNAIDGEYGPALQAAICFGREDAVRLLISYDAGLHSQGGSYGSALIAACSRSLVYHSPNLEVVKLLLDNGADANAQTRNYQRGDYSGTALQAAAASGSKEIVILLLDRGADVNAQSNNFHSLSWYGNALQAACANGKEQTVRLLLERGADPRAEGGKYGSALNAAKRNKNNNEVKLIEASLSKHRPYPPPAPGIEVPVDASDPWYIYQSSRRAA